MVSSSGATAQPSDHKMRGGVIACPTRLTCSHMDAAISRHTRRTDSRLCRETQQQAAQTEEHAREPNCHLLHVTGAFAAWRCWFQLS